MKQIIKRKNTLIERLHELAPKMLLGSSSETYRTCGRPDCRCHTTGPKHGPHMHVNYKGENGRTTGYYVPKGLMERVREGLDAWKEFQATAKEIAALNEQLLMAERPSQKKRKKMK